MNSHRQQFCSGVDTGHANPGPSGAPWRPDINTSGRVPESTIQLQKKVDLSYRGHREKPVSARPTETFRPEPSTVEARDPRRPPQARPGPLATLAMRNRRWVGPYNPREARGRGRWKPGTSLQRRARCRQGQFQSILVALYGKDKRPEDTDRIHPQNWIATCSPLRRRGETHSGFESHPIRHQFSRFFKDNTLCCIHQIMDGKNVRIYH